MSIHPAIKPVSWLIGNWTGKKGSGIYPTIESFNYQEDLEVTHPASNQPVLHLKFSSWFEKEDGERVYAHFEYGFLKAKPNTLPLYLTYTSAHNNGLALIEEGTYDINSKQITIVSTNIGRTTVNNPPVVLQTKKTFQLLTEEKLSYKMFMSLSTNQNLDLHLSIDYERIK